jgi:hypothetical protein
MIVLSKWCPLKRRAVADGVSSVFIQNNQGEIVMKKMASILVVALVTGCTGMQPQTGQSTRAMKQASKGTPLCVKMGDTGCAGSIGPVGAAGTPGAPGAVGPRGATIPSIVVTPMVIRPGATTNLQATVGETAGKPYTYKWAATEGKIGDPGVNPATWTAPDAVGSYIVSVEMNDGAETVKGFGTVTVSVMPVGPIIVGVAPSEAKAGGVIAITGVGFGEAQGKNRVIIGGVDATQVTAWSNTEVRAIVPVGAITGPIKLIVSGAESSLGHLAILWEKENPQNVVLSTGVHNHVLPRIVSDGSDGGIVVWQDNHPGDKRGNDIYAQKINSLGQSLWAPIGVVVSTAMDNQTHPKAIADGAGGAIVVWQDARGGVSFDVYAQRINPKGEAVWGAKGVAVATGANDQIEPRLVSDGAEGAIVLWQDFRSGSPHLYAQRVGMDGKVTWTADGMPVSVAAGGQTDAEISPDGAGGAVISWQDMRNGKHLDIYAQRIDGAGAPQWATDGVAVSMALSDQIHSALVGDGTGGATVVWEDWRSGAPHVYGQHVDGVGKVTWAANGISLGSVPQTEMAGKMMEGEAMKAVSGHPPVRITSAKSSTIPVAMISKMRTGTPPKGQTDPQVVSDALGGAIVVWQDTTGVGDDIYAQRVNGAGQTQWTVTGVSVSNAAGAQKMPGLVEDGKGGVVVTWDDHRNGEQSDVYAQRVNNSGKAQWTENGTAVSTAEAAQSHPHLIPDGSGGAILAWQDTRAGQSNIYVQKVSAGGLQ